MKKYFIMPIAIFATTAVSLSIGTSLSIGEVNKIGNIYEDNLATSIEDTPPTNMFSEIIEVTSTTIEIRTNWTSGTGLGKESIIKWTIATESDPTLIVEKDGTGTYPVETIPKKFGKSTPLMPNTWYEIKIGLGRGSLYDEMEVLATETILILTDAIAPTMNVPTVENHSAGTVEITADFEDNNSIIDKNKSKVKIYEGNTVPIDGTPPIQEFDLNEDEDYIYKVSGLEPTIDGYIVETSIKTDFDFEEEVQLPPIKTTKTFTPLGLDEIMATTTITEKSPANFGMDDGIATISTAIIPKAGETINEVSCLLDGESETPMNEFHLPKTTQTIYVADVSGFKANDVNNIEVTITYDGSKTLTQNEWTTSGETINSGTITTKSGTEPIITSTIEEGVRVENKPNGETKYWPGSLEMTIVNDKDAFQINKSSIDSTNAMFGVVDSNATMMKSSNLSIYQTGQPSLGYTITFKLGLDLFVSKEHVDAGYTLGLIGLEIPELDVDIDPWLNFVSVEPTPIETLSNGAIVGIVIGSIAGVALLGGGSYWLIKNKG